MNNFAKVRHRRVQNRAGIRNGLGRCNNPRPFPTRAANLFEIYLYRDKFVEQVCEPWWIVRGIRSVIRSTRHRRSSDKAMSTHAGSRVSADANQCNARHKYVKSQIVKKKVVCGSPHKVENPMMSMWLSGAKAVMGTARSRATAEGKRQATAIMAESTKQMMRFWTGGLIAPAPRKKKRSR